MQTPSSLRPRPATAQAARLRAPVPRALAYGVALACCSWPLAALAQGPAPSAWDAPPALRTSPLLQEKIPDAVRPQLPVFVKGDRISGQTDLNALIEGNAELRRGDTVIHADRLDYNVPEDLAKANGKVRINRAGNVYEGTALELRVDAFEGFFSDARYQFLATQAHGDATRVDFIDRYRAVVHNATYTTCERGNEESWEPDWVLRAGTLRLDNDEEVGTAENAVLEFKGISVLPIPYITFPLSDKRKSGLLPPTIGLDSRDGVAYIQPYYWNIAPNRDATLRAALMTKRGANLGGMGGRLTGLSSDPDTIAELDLRGRVDNAAPVVVVGRLNPFRQDRALDIRASVKDFEISSVSTYAAKYVGYGIEKGKLSAQLGYKIEDRKLSATNQVFLDQLTFGDKVDSPSALKLPVLLAVSLLKNSRGEIDLDLPVGGSLDDPQFSVGGIVVKVIVNLIGKAITSPFALLGSIFGGNAEELAWLDFEPGFARLGPGSEDKLRSIARVMADKPGLKLEIAGRVDPATDREGLGRAMLLGKVEALKVKDMAKKGESLADDGRVTVSPAEYPALLTRVYKDEKFPKPRNVIGLAKELPVSEMEKLILANTKVGDEDVRLLGAQRAQAVKSWLLDKGQVPAERVFLLSTHEGDDGKQPKARVSRVDFSLR